MSDQIDKLRKSRGVFRSSFTRGANEFEQILQSEPIDMDRAAVLYELWVTKFERLKEMDSDLYEAMLSVNETSEDDLLAEIEGCDGYRTRHAELKFKYDRHREAVNGSEEPQANSGASIAESGSAENQQVMREADAPGRRKFKLPKIEFLRFDGNVKDWLSFWAQFKKIHEDDYIDENDKIGYLIQATVPGSRARQLVESFPALADNYEKIVNALQSRFGREDLQIEVYVRELLKLILSNTSSSRKTDISVLYDKIETQLRALETLGITSDKCAAMLFPLIESCLPQELLRVWQRSSSGDSLQRFSSQGSLLPAGGEITLEGRLQNLMRFLRNEVENEQRIALASEGFGLRSTSIDASGMGKRGKSSESQTLPTASGLINCNVKCVFCDGSHEADSCFKARKLSFDEKRRTLVEKSACFRCLKIGHQAKKCRGRMLCMLCNKSHHTLMCTELPGNKQNSQETKKEIEVNRGEKSEQDKALGNHTRSHIFLQTLRIGLKCVNGTLMVRALIDTGSHRSYILKSTASRLGYGPKRKERLIHCLFGGAENANIHDCFDITVSKGSYTCNFEVLDQLVICNDIPSVFYGPWSKELNKEGIEISDKDETSAPIELLIGADVAGRLYTGDRVVLPCGLIAVETVLGWTVMGKVPSDRPSSALAMTTLSLLVNDASISKLWELDALGITEPTEKKTREELAEATKNLFRETVKINGEGRYEVRLPWLEGHPPLSTNYKVARKRLSSIVRKLENENLVESYDAVFQEWLSEGIIERIEGANFPERGHYLPHRPVIKENSATTKIRPVFDASAREKDGVSLNDCLEKGPNLIERIPSLLMRFRENPIGVVADIRKAFLQISLNEEDREFLKFLWIDNEGNIIAYRHKRAVFGVNSSPFLLGATIEHHLTRCRAKCMEINAPYSLETVTRLDKSFYVDNCVTSVTDKTTLKQFIRESIAIMADAKFDLRGWEFNGNIKGEDSIIPVLGLQWDLERDVLRIHPESLKVDLDSKNVSVTKRIILSLAQRVFDTIGFTCPSTLIPKLLLQRIWEKKLSWDEPVDAGTEKAFRAWLGELPYLFEIEIPRWIGLGTNNIQYLSIHTFCDASANAFSSVVFLRVAEKGCVRVHLMASKARVAPVRKLTIPRLELLAAVIGARLYANVKENLHREIESFFWSDSTTVVSWIQRKEQWGTFVWNRVAEIRTLTDPESWRHVPGEQNPADLPSRGCLPKQLLESKWWEGPNWLYEEPEKWPKGKNECDEVEVARERRKQLVTTLLNNTDDFWHTNYFSEYMKIVRTMAWISRFAHNSRKPRERRIGELNAEEIDKGEKFLLKLVQAGSFSGENMNRIIHLKPYCDEDGLLRLRTRISSREDTESFRFPVVLPSRHHVVETLILKEHVDSCHTGVQGVLSKLREKYWILGGRRTIRSVLAKCFVCRRHMAKSLQAEAPPLPLDRVRDAGIFEVTGVDLAGPLYLKGGEKVWICLFTCAIFRAVHLELVTSLSTHSFMQALRRFVARRGRPKTLYSDNGTNFTGADNALSQLKWDEITRDTAIQRIEWRFNPPSAPWWGGFWERMIGVMKRMLRKVLGRACLSYEDLLTTICDCEAVINARPITYESDDPKELVAITPAAFLVDQAGSGVPDCDVIDRSSLCRKMRYKQKIRDDLRRRFRTEYLGQLKSYYGKKPSRQVKLGEVVLIGNDQDKRIDWPLGRVVEILPGKDNQIRLTRVETARGQLLRPVQRLYPLEVVDSAAGHVVDGGKSEVPEEVPSSEYPAPQVNESAGVSQKSRVPVVNESAGVSQKSRVPVVTRSGRVSKPPDRFIY